MGISFTDRGKFSLTIYTIAKKHFFDLADRGMDSFTIVIDASIRGVTSIRAVTNFDNESGEVCMRMAEKLVQWSFGLMPHAINGEAIF